MPTSEAKQGFRIRTEMPIVVFSSLLGENKNESSDKMIALVGIEPGPSYAKSNMESEGPGSIPTRGIILSHGFFLFSHSKDEIATTGISVRMCPPN